MSDLSSNVGAIQSWIASVNTAFTELPTSIAQDASSGNFDDVFSNIQSFLSGGSSSSSTSSTSSDLAAQTTGQQALLTGALGTTGATGSQVVSTAEQELGVPYVWGGTSPSGFDCSGLVQYVYNQLGVSLPRTADEQSQVGTAVPSLADAQPGDLVFFAGADGTAAAPGHVGIYIGNGEMIDAPETGMDVSIQPVGDPVAIRRILSQSATPAATTTPTTTSASPELSSVPADLLPLFQASASQYGVPVNLLTAVAQTESGFDTNAVSSAGAEGLMQLMPSTAAGLGVNPLDPAQAIDGAAQLLSGYLQTYKSTPLALAAYNAGPAAVAQYGGIPPYAQTQDYVQTIMSEIGSSS